MLILSRRAGEKVIIDAGGYTIEVMPLGIDGAQVKLGIQAPRHMSVHREEVAERIKQEKEPQA